jgi:ectoine hydroxylase-related dioxygenase (phytanoyl-CoA dioxygenase family)
MAFFPRYWSQGVRNGSSAFNYYEWNADGRKNAAKHIESDDRRQPRAEEPLDLHPQVRVVCPAGGVILFSGAQLHATVPNTSGRTRFSIDFRTADLDDLVAKRGAPNVDSSSTGTSLRDLMRGTDLSRFSAEVIGLYEDRPPTSGVLVFQPD